MVHQDPSSSTQETDTHSEDKTKDSLTKWSLLLSVIALALAISVGFLAWETRLFVHQVHHAAETEDQRIQQRVAQAEQQTQAVIAGLQEQAGLLGKLDKRISAFQNELNTVASTHTSGYQALAKIGYLLHMADLQLTLNKEPMEALQLLQLAEQGLSRFNSSPYPTRLRQSLQSDIVNLQRVTQQFNVVHLLSALQELDQLITALPSAPQKPPVDAALPTLRLETPHDTTAAAPVLTIPWYKQLGESILNSLKQLVIIRHVQDPAKRLLSDDQLSLLKERIHLKVAEAEWAALQRNTQVYRLALTYIQRSLRDTYPQQDRLTEISRSIQSLLAIDIAVPLPRLSDTLDLFDRFVQQTAAQPPPSNTSTNSNTSDTGAAAEATQKNTATTTPTSATMGII